MTGLLYQNSPTASTEDSIMAITEELKQMSMQTATHLLPEAQNQS